MSVKSRLTQAGDGTAIPAEMVGYSATITTGGNYTTSSATYANFSTDIVTGNILPGNYLIIASGAAYQSATLGASGYVASAIQLIDSASTVLQEMPEIALWEAGTDKSKTADVTFCMVVPFSTTTTKTVRLQGKATVVGGASGPTLGIRTGAKIIVVRIA